MTSPQWVDELRGLIDSAQVQQFRVFPHPAQEGRKAAVLMLFGDGERGPDVLVIERAATLRDHGGQPAFPGGAIDPDDDGPIAAALREAEEETGVRAHDVEVLGELPEIWLPPSRFYVTPVVAWWHSPGSVSAVDAGEVATVARVPVAHLADPAHRVSARHPTGWVGPAFIVDHMLVWGFTAGLLDRVLDLTGWAQPWDSARIVDLPGDRVRS